MSKNNNDDKNKIRKIKIHLKIIIKKFHQNLKNIEKEVKPKLLVCLFYLC